MFSQPQQPHLTTITSTHLLEGLRASENRTVWTHFTDRYRPMIVRYVCRRGLHQQDAEDVAQQILLEFCVAYREGGYDREKGRLRHWLFGIARNQVNNAFRRARGRERQADPSDGETDFFDRQGDERGEQELREIEEQEWRRAVLTQCLDQVRSRFDTRTMAAFMLLAEEGRTAKDVAQKLGMTENAVYLAKYKISKRIRELRPQMEEAW